MITFKTPKHHWNYYLAIVNDLEKITQYVEFSKYNKDSYSIRFAHLLLAAASEVDVILKQLCKLLDNSSRSENIDQYRQIIRAKCPDFINEEIIIKRYTMTFKPWELWKKDINPKWWKSYNNVKHKRNNHFKEANLQNTVNAVGGLLISVLYLYKFQFSKEMKNNLQMSEVTYELQYKSGFIEINNDEYY